MAQHLFTQRKARRPNELGQTEQHRGYVVTNGPARQRLYYRVVDLTEDPVDPILDQFLRAFFEPPRNKVFE